MMKFLKLFLQKANKSIGHGPNCCNRGYVRPVIPEHKFKDFEVKNEPVLEYLCGSKERTNLENELKRMSSNETVVPIIIGKEEIKTKNEQYQVMPHSHQTRVAKFFEADEKMVQKAVGVALDSQVQWDKIEIMDRIDIWMKAADLLAGKYRSQLVAATMLGQGKTVQQAEIDAACELVDFMRWNAYFLKELLKYKPISPNENTKNTYRYRGIDGFIAAISPFNFTAIGGNLAYAPALCGNAVVWKPSPFSILSNYIIFKAMTEAGVPPGVVNFVPAPGPMFGDIITSSPCLAAINFTGSPEVFQTLWQQVGSNISQRNVFPRMIGECGGKNFHFVHPSADPCAVIPCTIRSAFEYCGQKCSACSRLYVPECLWPKIEPELVETTSELKIGDVREFDTFTGAVINKAAYDKIVQYLEYAKKNDQMKVLCGGGYSDSTGYYICPTIIVTQDPSDKLMTEEIFGPVLTVYVYKDKEIKKALELVRRTTKYALTGAIFTEDEKFIGEALHELKYSAGNLYINTKSTSAIVAQQPFGGGKLSGTNDKAGGPHYLLRYLSPQALKEDIVPDREVYYKHMEKGTCHTLKI